MLIKKIIFTLLLFSCIVVAPAQEFILRGGFGLGTFSMKDLKSSHQRSIKYSDIRYLKNLDDFPPYYIYELELLSFITPELGIGFLGEFQSTGSRIYYGDYSGYSSNDILTESKSYGSILTYRYEMKNKFFINLEFRSGIKYSNIASRIETLILGDKKDFNRDYKSLGKFIEPRIRLEKLIFKKIYAGAYLGYEYNLRSKIKSVSEDSRVLLTVDGRDATINWSGLRCGISIAFILRKKDYPVIFY